MTPPRRRFVLLALACGIVACALAQYGDWATCVVEWNSPHPGWVGMLGDHYGCKPVWLSRLLELVTPFKG